MVLKLCHRSSSKYLDMEATVKDIAESFRAKLGVEQGLEDCSGTENLSNLSFSLLMGEYANNLRVIEAAIDAWSLRKC